MGETRLAQENVITLESCLRDIRLASSSSSSLFDKLPVELASEVFLLLVIVPAQTQFTMRTHRVTLPKPQGVSPLLLCHICRRWRAIACATPTLWVNISLRFKKPLPGAHECALPKQWIDRAGGCSLSISVPVGRYYQDFATDVYMGRLEPTELRDREREMTAIILSVMYRCRTLYVPVLSEQGCLDFYKINEELADLTSLEELHLMGTMQRPAILTRCPRLRTLESTTQIKYHMFHFTDSHFRSIRCLKTTGQVSDLMTILTIFPTLVECNFNVDFNSTTLMPGARTRTTPLIVPNIEILHLNYRFDMSSVAALWDRINLPSLKSFHIILSARAYDPIQPVWPSLCSLIERSHAPLEHFGLESSKAVPEHGLTELIGCMPTLRSLELLLRADAHGPTIAFWQAFRGNLRPLFSIEGRPRGNATGSLFTPASLPICPRLECLLLIAYMEHTVIEVASAILSRFTPPPHDQDLPSDCAADSSMNTLEKVKLMPCWFTREDFLQYPGVENMCLRAGMKVDMTNSCLTLIRGGG